MKLDDHKRLHEAMEIPSKITGSPFKYLLEKMFNVIERLKRETTREVNYDNQVGGSMQIPQGWKVSSTPYST